MGKLYHEYEIRDTASNKIVDTIYIQENTETTGWVLGTWYMSTDGKRPLSQIKSKDNSQVATYKGHTFDTSSGDLF